MIEKKNGRWLVDIQPGGRGAKRFRKSFDYKPDALQWKSWVENQVRENPDWQPKRRDTRKLSELIELWYQLHGQQLRSDQYRALKYLCYGIGNPTADRLTAKLFTDYRAQRITAGVSPNSANREHAYLRAMFNELKRLGHWHLDNPVILVRQFSLPECGLTYLTDMQIGMLLEALQQSKSQDAYRVTLLALATGARWSEAETLRSEYLLLDPAMVAYTDTKSGRNRSIPIDAELAKQLKTKATGRLFAGCYAAFRSAVDRAGIDLPQGQLSHVLRHTFASHFMAKGGNILVLQKILGHQSLNMTMKYSHLAPGHLKEAAILNPVAGRLIVDNSEETKKAQTE